MTEYGGRSFPKCASCGSYIRSDTDRHVNDDGKVVCQNCWEGDHDE